MATVPNWIQQDNDQKAEEVRKADEAWKRCLEGGGASSFRIAAWVT
jgi:hypothetical protein